MDANQINALIKDAVLEGGEVAEVMKSAVSNAYTTVFVEKENDDFMGMVYGSLQTILAYSSDYAQMIGWYVRRGVEY